MGWNDSRPGSTVQSSYGSGLGTGVQAYGQENPWGPYSFLPGAPQSAPGSGQSSYGGQGYSGWKPPEYQNPSATPSATSTTTASSGPSANGEAFFNSVLSGEKVPFNPTVRANQVSRMSDMTSAAEGANNSRNAANAAAGGASASDPSFQAAQMGNQNARQIANQTGVREIDTNAEQQNFGAQMNAAENLNQNQMRREAYAHGDIQSALGFLPGRIGGGGGSSSSGPNNFNLPQQQHQNQLDQQLADQRYMYDGQQDIRNDYRYPQTSNDNAGGYRYQS